MDLEKIKGNKWVATIGVLTPLIITIILVYVVSQLFILFLLIPILIHYLNISYGKRLLKIHKTRTVYTKYGIFFLYPKIEEGVIKCSVYKNKYWLYLSKVPVWRVEYRGDLDYFVTCLEGELSVHYDSIDKKKERKKKQKDLMDSFNKWDGATDVISRRDKLIDEII